MKNIISWFYFCPLSLEIFIISFHSFRLGSIRDGTLFMNAALFSLRCKCLWSQTKLFFSLFLCRAGDLIWIYGYVQFRVWSILEVQFISTHLYVSYSLALDSQPISSCSVLHSAAAQSHQLHTRTDCLWKVRMSSIVQFFSLPFQICCCLFFVSKHCFSLAHSGSSPPATNSC